MLLPVGRCRYASGTFCGNVSFGIEARLLGLEVPVFIWHSGIQVQGFEPVCRSNLRFGIAYYTHIPPLVHCASSNMSRLEWMMNWFMYCAVSGKRKRAMPSPPPFDVPKAMLNKGVSVGDRMVK